MRQTNPVLSRVAVLVEHWNRFADNPTPRLLNWNLAGADAAIVLAFAQTECTPDAETAELFLVADEPFEDSHTFAESLTTAVVNAWGDDAAGLMESGVRVSWHPPTKLGAESTTSWLVRMVTSLASAQGAPWQHVVLALLPPRISNSDAWLAFLDALSIHSLPESVRVLVTDDPAQPALEDRMNRLGPLAVRQTPDLNTGTLAQEIVATSGGSGPGVEFRSHMTNLLAAVPSGDVDAALAAAASASNVAVAQGWHALNASVFLATSQVFVSKGDHERALPYMEQGFEAARAATEAGDGLGLKIEIQALTAIGGSMLLLGKPENAAAEFMAAGMRADALGDPWHRLESWRLAATALHQGGDRALAWATGAHALEACAALPSDQIRYSTLPWLRDLLKELSLDRSDQEREALAVVMADLQRHSGDSEVQA